MTVLLKTQDTSLSALPREQLFCTVFVSKLGLPIIAPPGLRNKRCQTAAFVLFWLLYTAITLIALCFPANGVLELQSTSFPPPTILLTPGSKLFCFPFLPFFKLFFTITIIFLIDVEFWYESLTQLWTTSLLDFKSHLERSKGKSAVRCYLYPGIIQHPAPHLHFVIMTAFNKIFVDSSELDVDPCPFVICSHLPRKKSRKVAANNANKTL